MAEINWKRRAELAELEVGRLKEKIFHLKADFALAASGAVTDDRVRHGVRCIKIRFLNWVEPPLRLPADHVIEESVRDILLYRSLVND